MIETRATVLGYPRMGPNRELKRVTEGYWAGTVPAAELRQAAQALRRDTWQLLAAAGLDELPVNDFSLYDHVLDTTVLLGAVPPRFATAVPEGTPDRDLARTSPWPAALTEVAPLEMTKWFDTNYHYLVPELGPGHPLRADPTKPLAEIAEARELGVRARPVLVGSGHVPRCWRSPPTTPRRVRSAEPARPGASTCTPTCCRSWPRPAPSGSSSTNRSSSPTCRRPHWPRPPAPTSG